MVSQREVWDAIAQQWFHFRQRPFPDIVRWLEKFSKEWKKGKLLEIGCGNCRNLLVFARAGFDCYGIDFSKEMLKYARYFAKKHHIAVKLKLAEATNLPFLEKSFDYILCIAVLHHLQGEKARIKALKEIWRVLKPGGEAFISVWNKLSWRWLFRAKERYIAWRVKDKTYMRYYYLFWPWEIERLLKQIGFKIEARQLFSKNICFLVKK
ncbi:MAG: class I SAM-dependent methyltransferase [Candidatus Pacearchaeota archaeon]